MTELLKVEQLAVAGIVPFAAAIAGRLFTNLTFLFRTLLMVVSAMLLLAGPTLTIAGTALPIMDLTGLALLALLTITDWRRRGTAATGSAHP